MIETTEKRRQKPGHTAQKSNICIDSELFMISFTLPYNRSREKKNPSKENNHFICRISNSMFVHSFHASIKPIWYLSIYLSYILTLFVRPKKINKRKKKKWLLSYCVLCFIHIYSLSFSLSRSSHRDFFTVHKLLCPFSSNNRFYRPAITLFLFFFFNTHMKLCLQCFSFSFCFVLFCNK